MLYRHVNGLLARCRATTFFQMNKGLQVSLLHRFSFCFFSLPGTGARSMGLGTCTCFSSWVQLRDLGGGSLVGEFGNGESG